MSAEIGNESAPTVTEGSGSTAPIIEASSSLRTAEVLRAVKTAWPILIALVPMALVLGAQAAQRGITVPEVTLMTAFNYAGGSEFAAVGLWASPLPVALIVGMTFLVNSRHLLMGAALAPYIGHLPRRVVYPALFFMVDESWALGLADAQMRGKAGLEPRFSLPYYAALGVLFWVPWFTFATVGAMVGPIVGDLGRWGFDLVFPAVFLVLVRVMWTTAQAARPWLVSLVVAATTHLAVPGAWYVPAGAIAGLAAAWLWAEEP